MAKPTIIKDFVSDTTQWGYDVPRKSQTRKSSSKKTLDTNERTWFQTSGLSQEFWRDFDSRPYSFSQPTAVEAVGADGCKGHTRDEYGGVRDKRAVSESEGTVTAGGDQTTLEEIWKSYALESTCHGLKNVANTYRRKWLRYLWLIFVLAMLFVLVYTITELFQDYQLNQTVTRSDVRVQFQPQFPSVTVCNMCPYKNLNQTSDNPMYVLMAQDTILRRYFPINRSDPAILSFMNLSALDVFETYSYTKEEMFDLSSYEGENLNINRDFETTDTPTGRCFTFNGPQYIAKHGVRRVNFDGRKSGLRMVINIKQNMYLPYDGLTSGVRMFISHHPETPRQEKDGLDIHPGTSTRVAVIPNKFQFLPHPYKSYGSEYCLNIGKDDLRDKMIDAPFYSRNKCVLQCQMLHASLLCNCYSHALHVKKLKPCTFGQQRFCINAKLHAVKAGNINVSCDCPRPCAFVRYNSIVSSSQLPSRSAMGHLRSLVKASSTAEIRENYLEVRIYLDSLLMRMESHEPRFTPGSILGFLGGQMGFFMGASLLTLAELGETFIFTLFYFFLKLYHMGKMRGSNSSSSGSNSS